GIGLDGRLESSRVGEVELAIKQLPLGQPGDVLVNDRGFTGYAYLAWHHHLALDYISRCSSGSFAAAQELFRMNRAARSKTVRLLAPAEQRAQLRALGLPLELTVRFVSVRLPTGELEVLATSLLDEQRYPSEEFLSVYHYRWNHETFYAMMKGRLDLENFSGQTTERSEEHTSELQSPDHLVCRLLLVRPLPPRLTLFPYTTLFRSRFVSVRLPTGELEVLATSLLDEQRYPSEEFLSVYHYRWNHETFYAMMKGRLDLENFSGQTTE